MPWKKDLRGEYVLNTNGERIWYDDEADAGQIGAGDFSPDNTGGNGYSITSPTLEDGGDGRYNTMEGGDTILDIGGDQARTEDAIAEQQEAAKKAAEYVQKGLEEVKGINNPLIEMGNEQLDALRRGVESGAWEPNENIYSAYTQYVAPQYEQGGRFQYESRNSLMTPERYQQFQANPAAFTYNQGGQQQQNQVQQPPQYNAEFAATLTPEQRNQYNQQQFGQVQGNQFVPNQAQVNQPQQLSFNQQQPEQLRYQNFQSNQQQPQFNPVQNFGQQPQQYRAQEAPQGQYVQPQQQYQGKQFRLEDDPVYQRRLADSNKAIEASAAARGMQLSGSNLKALQQNAGELAAQEGDAAFNRFQQQDQTNYGRFQDQRTDLKDTTRYQTEDQYRRYLDSVGIKGSEAAAAIGQWNTDRQFNQGANVQNFQTGQNAYIQNRGQDADIYNMNAGNQLAFGNQNLGQYNADRNFALDVNNQNYGQFNTNRNFDANRYDQNFQNTLDVYGINNDNYTNDRNFNYGVNQDYNADRFAISQYNTGNRQTENADLYGQVGDRYQRDVDAKKNKYGMIGGLYNVGDAANQRTTEATMSAYGTLADLGMQSANAKAAGAQAINSNNGLLDWIGL